MPRTGRPPKLDMVISEHRDPTTGALQRTTIYERVIQALKVGTPIAGVADSVGVNVDTIRDWMRQGARYQQDLHAGKINRGNLSENQRRVADFSADATRAAGEWEVRANTLLEQISQGGLLVRTVTEKVDADGHVIERSTKTETTLPDPKVIITRLKMTRPDRYAERREITGPEGAPIPLDVRVASLVESIEAQRRQTPELNS